MFGGALCLAVNVKWASHPCCADISGWKSPFIPLSLQCRDWRQVDNDLAQPTCGCPPSPTLQSCLRPSAFACIQTCSLLLHSSPFTRHIPLLPPPPHTHSPSSHSTFTSFPHLGPWLGRSRSRWRCARSRRSNARQHPPRRSSTHCLHSAPGCGCARRSAGEGGNGLWRG